MGFVGDMLSGSKGAGFQAQGVSTDQLNQGYTNTQNALTQQQAFVNALAGQNGLANQSSVFNQQQNLANQLQNVANGTGPNPALAQLNQTTGTNVSNQAALMAGQRGSAANAGLIARLAAQQGAATQQQAVGQGATLQAQQQLAAMQQLQNQQASMGNLANSQIAQQQAAMSAQNSLAAQQQANMYGLQGNVNSANAGIAGANTGGQQNLLSGVMGGIGSAATLFGGSSAGGGVATSAGPEMAGGAGDAISGVGDGLMVAAKGGMIEAPKRMATGGSVSADPLMTAVPVQTVAATPMTSSSTSGPQSNVVKTMNIDTSIPKTAAKSSSNGIGSALSGVSSLAKPAMQGLMSWGEHEALPYLGDFFGGMFGTSGALAGEVAGGAGDAITSGGAVLGSAETGTEIAAAGETAGEAAALAAKGGKIGKQSKDKTVPALLSPGERYYSPHEAKAVATGKAKPREVGKEVPGEAPVKGAKNSYANDIVPVKAEVGAVIAPRSKTQAKDSDKKIEAFVKAVLAKKGRLPAKDAK